MNIKQFLDEFFVKEEVKDIALHFGHSTTGKKNEIIDRIVFCKDFKVKEFSEYFSRDQLYILCWNLSLPVSGTKDELWDRIVTKFRLDKEIPIIEEVPEEKLSIQLPEVETISEQQLVEEQEVDAETIEIEDIIRKWVPDRRYNSEEGYQVELSSLLKHKYGFKVQNEVGSTRIDILVNDTIPIELKKNPKRGDFDRLSGQIIRNIDAYGKLIVVICQLETQELYMEYENSLKNRYSSGELIFIVKS